MPVVRRSREVPQAGPGFGESLTSNPIVFIVGPEKKEFHIHKDLVTQTSPVLNAMLNGKMREAVEGRVNWPDVDVDTFVRFSQFIYSQNYNEAEPEILVDSDQQTTQMRIRDGIGKGPDRDSRIQCIGRSSSDEAGEDDGYRLIQYYNAYSDFDETTEIGLPTSLPYSIVSYCAAVHDIQGFGRDNEDSDIGERRKLVHLLERACKDILRKHTLPNGLEYTHRYRQMMRCFYCCIPTNLPEGLNIPESVSFWGPRPNTSPYESYGAVIFSHARLYLLADKYDMVVLKTLALGRLRKMLMEFQFYPESAPDIISLAQEVYENTVEQKPCRLLVALYIGCFVEHIHKRDEFRRLVREGGELVQDIFEGVAARLEPYPPK